MKILLSLKLFFCIVFTNLYAKPPETYAKLHTGDFSPQFFSENNNLESGIFKALYEKRNKYKEWYKDLCAYDDNHPEIIKTLLDLWRKLYFRMGKGADSLHFWNELQKEISDILLDDAKKQWFSWCDCGFTSKEDRLKLLLRIFDDLCEKILAKPDKDFFSKSIIITSLASGGCLFELLLVAGLFTFGFKNIELNLIDHGFSDTDYKSNKAKAFAYELNRLGFQDRSQILNFYTNGYDYIFKVLDGSAHSSDIIFGTDYGTAFFEDSTSKNKLTLSNQSGKEIISVLFSPKTDKIRSIFVTTDTGVSKIIDFLREIEPHTEIDFFDKATFYKTEFLSQLPDYKVSIGEFSPQTFDDLVKCTGNPGVITYQIQKHGPKGFTQDSALCLQLNQGQSGPYSEYTLQFRLDMLSHNLKKLKEKLTRLVAQLKFLQEKLVSLAS